MAHGLKIKKKPHHVAIKHGHRTLKKLRKITTAVVVLVLVFGCGAFLYSLLGSQNSGPVNKVTLIQPPKPRGPSKPPPDAKVGVALRYVTEVVKRGENASLTIHTNPDCKCTIKVEYAATDRHRLVEGKDSGLVTKIADEYGLASWSWSVPIDAPTGLAYAWAECANKKHAGMYIGNINVK